MKIWRRIKRSWGKMDLNDPLESYLLALSHVRLYAKDIYDERQTFAKLKPFYKSHLQSMERNQKSVEDTYPQFKSRMRKHMSVIKAEFEKENITIESYANAQALHALLE